MRISDWSSDVCSSDLIPEVDVVIAAVEAKDLDALLALVEWQETACTTETGQGAGGPPPCETGQADGTVVRVFPNAGRTAERRVGEEGVRACRPRWSPEH